MNPLWKGGSEVVFSDVSIPCDHLGFCQAFNSRAHKSLRSLTDSQNRFRRDWKRGELTSCPIRAVSVCSRFLQRSRSRSRAAVLETNEYGPGSQSSQTPILSLPESMTESLLESFRRRD
jgi:hypothetical protein